MAILRYGIVFTVRLCLWFRDDGRLWGHTALPSLWCFSYYGYGG